MASGFRTPWETTTYISFFDSDHELKLQEREVIIAVPTWAHFIPSLNFIIKIGKKVR